MVRCLQRGPAPFSTCCFARKLLDGKVEAERVEVAVEGLEEHEALVELRVERGQVVDGVGAAEQPVEEEGREGQLDQDALVQRLP